MQLSDARSDRCMEASTWVPEWATNHRNQVEKREAKKKTARDENIVVMGIVDACCAEAGGAAVRTWAMQHDTEKATSLLLQFGFAASPLLTSTHSTDIGRLPVTL